MTPGIGIWGRWHSKAVDGSTHPTPTTDVRWVGTMAAESVAARVGWLDASMVVTWEAIQVDGLVGQWDKLTAASMAVP